MSVFLKAFYPSAVHHIETNERILYITFDDGPVPEATIPALELLKKYHAKATFFCVGKNIINHGDVFQKMLDDGHCVGNHTNDHLNGIFTGTKSYVENVSKCAAILNVRYPLLSRNSKPLFRPPYGKLTPSQYTILKSQYKIVFWDAVSRDWIKKRSAESCFQRVKKYAKPGSIVLFHDNFESRSRMLPALEKTLDYFSAKGYRFDALDKL